MANVNVIVLFGVSLITLSAIPVTVLNLIITC